MSVSSASQGFGVHGANPQFALHSLLASVCSTDAPDPVADRKFGFKALEKNRA